MRPRSSAPASSGPSCADELKDKAIAAGLYAANMPAEVGGAGLDTVTWVLYEKELGKANYRAALELRRAAFEHPDGLRRRAAPALPSALRQRREIRLPGHDRAGGGFRRPQHEDRRRCATAPTSSSTASSTSSAMPMRRTSSSCSRPRAKRRRPAAGRSSSPPFSSTRARRVSRVRPGYATCRIAATTMRSSNSTTAGCR